MTSKVGSFLKVQCECFRRIILPCIETQLEQNVNNGMLQVRTT